VNSNFENLRQFLLDNRELLQNLSTEDKIIEETLNTVNDIINGIPDHGEKANDSQTDSTPTGAFYLVIFNYCFN
jgi:CHASE3 domain sensor protein